MKLFWLIIKLILWRIGNEQELVDKYKKQLELYKMALEKSLNLKVKSIYIYSLYLQKEIDIYKTLEK